MKSLTAAALRCGTHLSRDFTVLPAHPCTYPRSEWTIPAFVFPAKAGTHLPSPEEWKTELAWVVPQWVNSQPKIAVLQLSQLLAAQAVMPHWATGAQGWVELMTSRPQAAKLTPESLSCCAFIRFPTHVAVLSIYDNVWSFCVCLSVKWLTIHQMVPRCGHYYSIFLFVKHDRQRWPN